MQELPPYMSFWGKASPETRPSEPASHCIAYHCFDVAAVADVLLRRNPRKLRAMARLLDTSPESARRLLISLIALHDVGKFSAAFQAKNADAWPRDVLGEWKSLAGGRHDLTGFVMRQALDLKSVLNPTLGGWSGGDIVAVWHAIAGHHGQPAAEHNGHRPDNLNSACLARLGHFPATSVFCTRKKFPANDQASAT